jgi:hypothetical protein
MDKWQKEKCLPFSFVPFLRLSISPFSLSLLRLCFLCAFTFPLTFHAPLIRLLSFLLGKYEGVCVYF